MATGDKIVNLDALKATYENIKGMIGPSESTSTAAYAHAKGTGLIYNGILYIATVDISAGDTLATTGTGANIAQVTGGAMGEVADVKSAINVAKTVRSYSFAKSSAGNIFDKDNPSNIIEDNIYYDRSSGEPQNNNSYMSLSIIVPTGFTYSLYCGNGNAASRIYGAILRSINDLAYIDVVSNGERVFSVPRSTEDYVYLTLSFAKTQYNVDRFTITISENQINDYIPYKANVPWIEVGKAEAAELANNLSWNLVPYGSIPEETLKQKLYPYILDGIGCTNYFDADYNVQNATQDTQYNLYWHTPVNYLPAGTYTISTCYNLTLISSDGTKTTLAPQTSNGPLTFTVTDDTALFEAMIYCRQEGVNFLRKISVVEGNTPVSVDTPAERKFIIGNKFRIDTEYYPTHWNRCNLVTIGDSITRGYAPADSEHGIPGGSQIHPTYGEYAAQMLNMNYLNLGQDGLTVRTCISSGKVEAIINAGITPDIVTILLGTNDMVANINGQEDLGTINDEFVDASTCSYYAGLKHIVDLLQTNFPQCTIVLLGNTPCQSFPISNPNSRGYLFNKAKKDVSELKNVVYFDWGTDLGFNLNNQTIYDLFKLNDVHPSAEAQLKMGKRITGFLSSI